ncbi:uncharacterized protein LOC128635859 [Bombina bombina]|uniref:uncharacterized protein LOC128635859 n=1 Tax=Bombina bombina TaxID=8345 RepID=UPI00235AB708|nr:uncharacterized protein LOC128635859 [Bombina bombina]
MHLRSSFRKRLLARNMVGDQNVGVRFTEVEAGGSAGTPVSVCGAPSVFSVSQVENNRSAMGASKGRPAAGELVMVGAFESSQTGMAAAGVVSGAGNGELTLSQHTIRVLRERAHTPMKLGAIFGALRDYPDREMAEFLQAGLAYGFRIPVRKLVCLPFAVHNLKSAYQFPEVLQEKIDKEVRLGRMAGPFLSPPLENLVVSPLGIVPKREPGKFRLIQHLSHPKGNSLNNALDEADTSVAYQSFESALAIVRSLGGEAEMAKVDIESAFRLLPIHPDSFHLMGCRAGGWYYVDRCLLMGCAISCAYFERFSSFLHWAVVRRSGLGQVAHYLDDFLFLGSAGSGECAYILGTMQSLIC